MYTKKIYLTMACIVVMVSIGLTGYLKKNTIQSKVYNYYHSIVGASDNTNSCIKYPDVQYFMYHYIRYNDPHDPIDTHELSVDPRDFEIQMAFVRQMADAREITLMNGINFRQAVNTGCFPGRHIWIFTSDDGWADTYSALVPLAIKYQVPFFFGIIADNLDQKGFLTTTQVQELSKNPLFTIASHSMRHLDQSQMDDIQERDEICRSKEILENIIQGPVWAYIYPAGRMSKQSIRITQQCGYELSWSTHFGGEDWFTDLSYFGMNRIPIHNATSIEVFKKLIPSNEQK